MASGENETGDQIRPCERDALDEWKRGDVPSENEKAAPLNKGSVPGQREKHERQKRRRERERGNEKVCFAFVHG